MKIRSSGLWHHLVKQIVANVSEEQIYQSISYHFPEDYISVLTAGENLESHSYVDFGWPLWEEVPVKQIGQSRSSVSYCQTQAKIFLEKESTFLFYKWHTTTTNTNLTP